MKAREDGFTLIELLVVVLILGLLAALALPSFIGQKGKASDAQAKSNLQAAQRAMETYYTDHETYGSANMNPSSDPDSLIGLEPTLADTPVPDITAQGSDNYTLRVVSNSSTPVTFRLRRRSNGQTDRTCSPSSTGGCASDGTW
jgi:type IV pilus assembly protein PilA